MMDLLYFIWVNVIFFGLPLIILGASVIGIIALIRTKNLPPIAKIVLVILALLILWYVEFYL